MIGKKPLAEFEYNSGYKHKVYSTPEYNDFLKNTNRDWFTRDSDVLNSTHHYKETAIARDIKNVRKRRI